MKLLRRIFAIALVSLFLVTGVSVTYHHSGMQETNYIASAASGVPVSINPSGNTNGHAHIFVLLSLNYRNEAELGTFLSELQDPASPLYHKYLTQGQFDNLFAPPASEYNGYAGYLRSTGLKVTTYPGRTVIGLSGTISQFGKVFHTTIYRYTQNGETFRAPAYQPWISYGIPGQISGITGLSNRFKPAVSPLFSGSGTGERLVGADMQAAYNLKQIYSTYGYPINQTIATLLWSGNNSGTPVAPFVPSDISYYFSHNMPSGEPLPTVYGYPVAGAPAPGPSASTDRTQANFESTLDLEMAGSVAPGSTVIEVYGPQPTMAYLDLAFRSVLYPAYNQTVDTALSHVVAISNSWGGTDGTGSNQVLWTQFEQDAAARGITVLAATGDNGNTPNEQPSFPASAAFNSYGTLAVGGAKMVLTGNTSSNGSETTGISTQSVWFNTPNPGNGSQGGVSKYYSEPSWQINSQDANSVITGSSSITGLPSGRGTPDVSGDGANMEIYITYFGSSSYSELWGTSIATPLVAGEIAVMDTALPSPEGFMNPLIYRMAQAEYNGSYTQYRPMYFITNGSNHMFSAKSGYSLAVGWGSINAFNFVQYEQPTASYAVNFTETGLPASTTWYVNITGGSSRSSSGNSIIFNLTNGNYRYNVSASGGQYVASGGHFTVLGAQVNRKVAFSIPHRVTFLEAGLPSGSPWYINVSAQPGSGRITGDNFTMSLPDGFYTYSAASSNRSYHSPSGTFTVSGSNISMSVNFSLQTYWINFSANYTGNGSAEWYVNLSNGQKFNSSSHEISFPEPNGTYDYTMASFNHAYRANPGNGTFTVTGSNVSVFINFTADVFTITFNGLGMPTGNQWSIHVSQSGATVASASTTGKSLKLSLANGSYVYSARAANRSYMPIGHTGVFTVQGDSLSIDIRFSPVEYTVSFNETGLKPGLTWGIIFSNGTSITSATGQINVNLSNGTYSFSIFSTNKSWAPLSGKGTVTVSGSSVLVSLKFSLYTYTVVFRETGLQSGTEWKITAGTHSYIVNGTSITLVFPNGTVHYSVKPISGYLTGNQSGNVTVSGHGVTVKISFIRQSGFSPLNIFFLVIVVGTIVAVSFVWTVYNRRK